MCVCNTEALRKFERANVLRCMLVREQKCMNPGPNRPKFYAWKWTKHVKWALLCGRSVCTIKLPSSTKLKLVYVVNMACSKFLGCSEKSVWICVFLCFFCFGWFVFVFFLWVNGIFWSYFLLSHLLRKPTLWNVKREIVLIMLFVKRQNLCSHSNVGLLKYFIVHLFYWKYFVWMWYL